MTENSLVPDRRVSRTDLVILSAVSLILFFYHLIISTLGHYGYFIDEVYYIACSKRLAWGYVDHPPLSIGLLALNRAILGDSLVALRVLPALAHAGTVFVTGLIAFRLGGTRPAIVLSALAVIGMPIYLLFGSFYSMNPFEILLCTGLVYLLIRMVQSDRPKDWSMIGLLIGLGLGMKHTMALYVVAIGIGLIVSSHRRLVWNRWFVLGISVASILVLPNLIWQLVNGFPSLEFYRNAMINKNIPTGPMDILMAQIVFGNPLIFPLWLAGLGALLFMSSFRQVRFLGWSYLFLLIVMVVSQSSRPDRISAIYPVLIAAGAVALQSITQATVRKRVIGLAGVLLTLGAIAAAPVVTPLLSPPATQRYLATLGLSLSVESGKTNDPLPQWLGDRLGWHDMAGVVARVYHGLPEDERRNAVIVSTNYGEAGAMEVYSDEFGLPPVYATHNSYHAWGPPPDSAGAYIAVMVDRAGLERLFESVEEAAIAECEFCTRPQQRVPIYVARRPKVSLRELWPMFKIYN